MISCGQAFILAFGASKFNPSPLFREKVAAADFNSTLYVSQGSGYPVIMA